MYNPRVTQYLRVTGFEKKCDGAAAVVVMPTEKAKAMGVPYAPIEVLGTGASAVEAGLLHNEHWATELAAKQVYDLTGVSPDEVDLFMCNDFFLASEIVSAEECGYIPRGEAWKYAIDGRTAFDGDKPSIRTVAVATSVTLMAHRASPISSRPLNKCAASPVPPR